MPARHRTLPLTCPVRVPPDDDACEAAITVQYWPGSHASHWDPPEGPEVHVLAAECPHLTVLQEEQPEHVDALLAQLEERDRDAYDAEMERRVDEARDREWDDRDDRDRD